MIPYLRSANPEVQAETCRILEVIGTQQSLAELMPLAGSPNPATKLWAGSAFSAISSRSGTSVQPPAVGQPSAAPAQAVMRTWTDSTGQFKVDAEFVDFKDGKANLRKADGTMISMPMLRLSTADQEFIREELRRRK